MSKKRQLKIVPLEERILLDAAIVAALAQPLTSSAPQSGTSGSSTASVPHAPLVDAGAAQTVPSASQPIIYVNANAMGSVQDGKSWATAYTSLQSALTQAGNTPGGDQIWIAQGTYIPSQIYSPNGVVGGASGLNDPHLMTFNIPNNTELYGGFTAGMTSISQANPSLYPTILSGDLLGNDVNNPSSSGYLASKADNAWHVVTLGNDIAQTGVTASLNGLGIIDGYANGPAGTPSFGVFAYNHNFGGGVYASFGSTLTMNRDLIEYNYSASDGGGIFTNDVNITVTNSSLLSNAAIVRGGGIESLNTYEGSTPHYSNLINDYFQGNTSTVFGGAVVGEGTFPNLASAMNINGSTFVHNSSPEGGAITIDSLTTNVSNSMFYDNIASVNGGALATTNIVDTVVGGPNAFVTTVNNSSFIDNVSQGSVTAHTALDNFLGFPIGIDFARGGGAITTYINGHLAVNGSLFLDNTALSGDGGAILNGHSSADATFGVVTADNATTTVMGSIFLGNQALDGSGGAIASTSDHVLPSNPADLSLTVTNSVLAGNSASVDGGAIALDTSLIADKGNGFLGNSAPLGEQFYASNAVVNGIASGSSGALSAELLVNKFLLLDSDDLYLA